MIPAWSNVVSTTPLLYPMPVGEARIRTVQEGIVPSVGFSHNNSFALSIGNPWFNATDVHHFVRLRGGLLLSGIYMDVRISPFPCNA